MFALFLFPLLVVSSKVESDGGLARRLDHSATRFHSDTYCDGGALLCSDCPSGKSHF